MELKDLDDNGSFDDDLDAIDLACDAARWLGSLDDGGESDGRKNPAQRRYPNNEATVPIGFTRSVRK